MAVGIVVGAAFTDLVKAFVSDWITPLVGCACRQLAGANGKLPFVISCIQQP